MIWYIDGVFCHGNKIHDGYNSIFYNLTINKVYRIFNCRKGDSIEINYRDRKITHGISDFLIEDDDGNHIWIPCQLFHDITIEEFRDYQIGKLINNE